MDYKSLIIKMLEKITDDELLARIWRFIARRYTK